MTSDTNGVDLSRVDTLLFSGGIGGAKLASGMARVQPPGTLAVVTNTGDDFTHLGLRVCPDLDTVMYTLAGIADPDRGWGLAEESWHCLEALERLGGPTWFNLGDRDLATHIFRSQLMDSGLTLSEVTAQLRMRLGVNQHILPMTDDEVTTMVESAVGTLEFQKYFVFHRCKPEVRSVRFEGAADAALLPSVAALLKSARPPFVVVAPSNPYLSIDPILALPEVLPLLSASEVTVAAVSPIVAGRALKGPTAKIMRELGLEPTSVAIARHYREFVDYLLIDESDADTAGPIAALGIKPVVTSTVMRAQHDKDRLAETLRRLRAEL